VHERAATVSTPDGSPDYREIRLEIDGRLARLTLDRPAKLNALGPAMLGELLDALMRVRRSAASVLVLTGNGRAFCAGVDLTSSFFMEGVDDETGFAGKDLLDGQHELIEALYDLPQLTVCAINGDAVGGAGFGMAMACDLRFAVPAARFWMIPIKVDVVQDFGLTWFLQRVIGQPRTLELLMTGRLLGAEEAERWGLVNRVVPDSELLSETTKLAETVAAAGHHAVLLSKQVVRHGASVDLGTELRHEAVTNGLCFHSADFRARQRAFAARSLGRGR
jgi:enoyl-CoA hydratase/carnithine racemase